MQYTIHMLWGSSVVYTGRVFESYCQASGARDALQSVADKNNFDVTYEVIVI